MGKIRITLLSALAGWAFAPASAPPRPAAITPQILRAENASRVLATLRTVPPRVDVTMVSAESAAAFIGVFGMLGLIRHRRRGHSVRSARRLS